MISSENASAASGMLALDQISILCMGDFEDSSQKVSDPN